MKKRIIFILALSIFVAACDVLDTKEDSFITQSNIDNQYDRVIPMGYASYSYMRSGLTELDNNIAAAKSDEAVQTSMSSRVRMFNNGSWSAYNNPDNPYESYYKGIRAANYFLDYSLDYKKMLASGRDTISEGPSKYRQDVKNVEFLRAESHIVKAYYYFELIKRYGGVPLYKSVVTDKTFLPCASYDEVVEYIVSEIDGVMTVLAADWTGYDDYDGRFNRGAAQALKSRVLLYAASPLNTSGLSDQQIQARWMNAAIAAYDVIASGKYSLSTDYAALFKGNTASNKEIIMSRRSSGANTLEKANYPIATPGGNSGLTPSHNLVSAYELTAQEDPDNPYLNRDPRLGYTVVTNGSIWNGRAVDISENGSDSYIRINSSRTGYYLKKYLADELALTQGQTAVHYWVYFRYAEILLNFAEAANEAWGPDVSEVESGLTARNALNQIRGRTSVGLNQTDLSKFEGNDERERMRNAIKAERRVELAFEDHRYWDLLRWEDGDRLSDPIMGIQAKALGNNVFAYEKFQVESRIFNPEKMYRYPIPFEEVSKSNGIVKQNSGW